MLQKQKKTFHAKNKSDLSITPGVIGDQKIPQVNDPK